MNKFLIVMAVCLSAFSFSQAQTEKGSQTLGVSGGANASQNNDYGLNPGDNSSSSQVMQTKNFNLGPQYSYFIADKLDIGVNLSYSYSSISYNTLYFPSPANNNHQNNSSTNYGGNVFIRKYYMYKNVVGMRAGFDAGYSGGTQKNTYSDASSPSNNTNSRLSSYFGSARLELVAYPTPKIGLSASLLNLEYQHYTQNNGALGHDSGDNLGLNFVNNGLYISVFYTIGGKKS